jgi:signal transduction histidine kinase
VEVEGPPTPLDALVRDEVFRIGREALVNAFQHAGARRVEVALSYGRAELRLRVRDDGRGLGAEVLHAGGRPGHWGLPGMRERARKIGARLDIHARGESGTEVELCVPASSAYACDSRPTWSQRLRRLAGGGR